MDSRWEGGIPNLDFEANAVSPRRSVRARLRSADGGSDGQQTQSANGSLEAVHDALLQTVERVRIPKMRAGGEAEVWASIKAAT